MTRASSQNISKLYTECKLSTKKLRCFYTATATEKDVSSSHFVTQAWPQWNICSILQLMPSLQCVYCSESLLVPYKSQCSHPCYCCCCVLLSVTSANHNKPRRWYWSIVILPGNDMCHIILSSCGKDGIWLLSPSYLGHKANQEICFSYWLVVKELWQ